MLSDTIERVNRLRQQAMSDPTFQQSAKEHEKALISQQGMEDQAELSRRRKQKSKPKSLADIYEQAAFGHNPTGVQH